MTSNESSIQPNDAATSARRACGVAARHQPNTPPLSRAWVALTVTEPRFRR